MSERNIVNLLCTRPEIAVTQLLKGYTLSCGWCSHYLQRV